MPGHISRTHHGTERDGTTDEVDTSVDLWAHNRTVKDYNEDSLLINISYAGRVLGVHKASPNSKMSSMRQPYSINTDGSGNRKTIGPAGEGVNRHLPIASIQVVEVEEDTETDQIFATARALGGSVCEANWEAPWGETCEEGEYVYMGISASSQDRRTRTIEVVHNFVARGDRKLDQHLHKWYGYERSFADDGTGEIIYNYDETKSEAQFLPVAGTDSWWDSGSILPKWSSVFAFNPIWK